MTQALMRWMVLPLLFIGLLCLIIWLPGRRKLEQSKSGLLILLFVRILLIPILGLVADGIINLIWLPAQLARHTLVLHGTLLAVIIVTIYTWAFYSYSLFRVAHARCPQWIFAGLLAALPALLVWFGLMSLPLLEPFSTSVFASFISPTNPANKVLLYPEGWMAQDLIFCVKQSWHAARRVTLISFKENMPTQFAYGQWTKDGVVFVCWLTVNKSVYAGSEGVKFQPIPGNPLPLLAYDFSTGETTKSSLPESYDADAKYTELQATIQKLIDGHGGLDNLRIDLKSVEQNEKPISWFWDLPPDDEISRD